MATLDAEPFDRMQQVLLQQADDAGRRLFDREAERFGELGLDGLAGKLRVERDGAARQRARTQPAQHKLRVGNGRVLAAQPIGCGAGSGAGALWPGVKKARIVDPGDRAAAGADRMDLNRRRREMVAVDGEFVGDRHVAARHHHHIAARAADLHRDQVGFLARRRAALERADTGRGAGENQHHRPRRHLVDRDRAAIALQQQQRSRKAELAQLFVEGAQVARHLGRHIGIHDGGRAALVFTHGRHDLARQRDPFAVPALGELATDGAFVRAIEEGVEQAYRDRLDAFFREDPGRGVDVFRLQRRQLGAVGGDAAAHREPQVARHQNLREGRTMVPLILADAATDLQRIAEALGRQHADLGALLLQDRVGRHRRAVHEQRAVAQECGQRDIELLGRKPQNAQHAFAGIGRNRGRLEDAHGAGRVAQHHVGEGAAHVDADAPGGDEAHSGSWGGRRGGAGHLDRLPSTSSVCSPKVGAERGECGRT